MLEKPAFIQGLFTATGQGLATATPLSPPARYRVPGDRRAQTVYFRAGNAGDELITLILNRNGAAMRYFPVGAKDALHVALAVLEDLSPETEAEVMVAGPAGQAIAVVIDIGFVEVP